MPEKIIWTLSTKRWGILRIRERGFMESVGSYRLVLEELQGGAFKIYRDGYFKSKDQAEEIASKINYLDFLDQRRERALKNLNYDFLDSIKGTKEHDFLMFQNSFMIRDCEFDTYGNAKAICSHDRNCSTVQSYVRKYSLPNAKRYVVEEQHDSYSFILHTYKGENIHLFNTASDNGNSNYGTQYKLHFEANFFTSIPFWSYRTMD